LPRITPISLKKYKKFLKYIGCVFKRKGKGDHLIYSRSDLNRPVVVVDDREVPSLHQETNLATLRLSKEDYLEILKQL
jgi:predicted RNA binding protein YcfA (HicA-like mRNA interferase family)